jgi:RNA polymerase sigma-70 factor (ECF subfamily)
VLQVGGAPDVARRALEELAHAYWYPLYAFARRRGEPPEAAQDLVQGFFAELLERHALERADQDRGRFRAFLRASFLNFCSRQRARDSAQKRGGGRPAVSLDADAELRFELEPSHDETAERVFERTWAHSVLERALVQVRARYVARDQGALFDGLKPHLVRVGEDAHAPDAAALGLTPGALRVAVHRLRTRFKAALEREVADTLDGAADVRDELRDLLQAVSR